MTRRPILAVMLGVACTLGLISWFVSGGPPTAAATPASVARERRTSLRDPAHSLQERRAVVPFGGADDAAECTLLVVDARDGRPVAGAEVACVERSRQALREALGDAGTLERLLGAASWSRRTDSAGRVLLPLPRRSALVAARSGARFGLVSLSSAREARLELHADSELAVDVVDEGGGPVTGAEVVLRANGVVAQRSATQHGGRATFPHAGWLLAGRAGPWSVGAIGLFRAPIGAALPADGSPQEPVRLCVPLCGSVLVALTDLDGRPYAGAVDVSLEGFEPHSERRVGQLEQRTVRGFARFEPVELGLHLRASTALRHIRVDSRAPGPAERGALARVELGFAGGRTILHGRAFAANGQPLRSTHLNIDWEGDWTAAARLRRRLTWTDQRGVFAIALGSGIPESAAPRQLHLTSARGAQRRLDLAAALAPGVHDVGTVRLVAAR